MNIFQNTQNLLPHHVKCCTSLLVFAYIASLSVAVAAITTHATEAGNPLSASDNKLPSGDLIAERINARDEGDMVTRTLTMQMINKNGQSRTRVTRGFRKYFDDEKRTVLFYISPRSVKDTAFLTYDYLGSEKQDDQWIYLPATRKVRRISAADRGDYFLGTDFTYEDIKKETKVEINDYHRQTVGEEKIDGKHCYIVESVPVNEKVKKELGYGKMRSWIDSEIWMVRKAQYWDTQDNLLKTTIFKEIKQHQNIWTPHIMEVENHKSGHKTIFTFSDIDYQSDIPDKLFSTNNLKRGL